MSVFIDSSGSISSGYYVFTKNTSFTITNNTKIEYLLIGGGGAGGTSHGGGGGGGGVVYKTNIPISAGIHSITVGSGGTVLTTSGNQPIVITTSSVINQQTINIKGGDTSISGINDIAYGGGPGGGGINGGALSSSTIASGGGGSGHITSKLGGKTTSGQGNNGGNSIKEPGGGGGGGGSGTNGFTNSSNNGGIGGDGTNVYSDLINIISPYMPNNWQLATISGYIASGGGGGTWENNYSALGGKGGGGSGGTNNGALIQPTNAIPNTGSGGGGGGSGGQAGANGASGLVIIYIKSINSSSGNYNVGTYNLKPINVNRTGSNNYNNISLIGSLQVNNMIVNSCIVQKVLKVYDGNIYLTNSDISITSNQFIQNDNIYFNSTGFFNDNSNIGQNKPVTITNILAGYDSTNYTLDSNIATLNTSGTITELSSVTLSKSGNWSDALNWTPNTAPILDYVPNVIIPIILAVTYDYDNLINNIPVCSILNNGTINFIGSSDYTFSNDISGTGFIIKDSSNVLTISSGNNSISNTTINKGTLKIGAINAVGTGNIIVNLNGILELNGYNINNNIVLSGTITNNINSENIYLYNPITLNYDSIFNCLGTINIKSQIQSNGHNISLNGFASYNLDNSSNIISSVRTNTSGSINLNSTIDLTLLTITCNHLIIKTSGNVIINGNINANSIYIQSNNITINSGYNIVSNNRIIFNSLNYFKNNSSSNAIISTNSNWVIYSKDPTLNTFGGLSSGNKAIWGKIYDSLSIPTTNTYIFSNNGTLIITTTNNSKIYGASSINISNNYTLSGTTQNYPLIFTPNLILDCSTTPLSISSLGTAQNATVQPYQIIASGLTAKLGFTISYINSGYLTLSKVNLNIVAKDDSKIYGESTTNNNLTYDNNGDIITKDSSGYTISGLINDIDFINSIKLSSLGAKSISSVSSYAIVPIIYNYSTNVNTTNYNIIYVNGNLNVTRRNFTISATDSSNNIYKGFAYDFTNKIEISGIVNNDPVQFNGNLFKADVGIYSSNLSVTTYNSNNYNDPIINNATFTINKANYISANGTEVYNGTNIFSNSNLLIIGVNGETFKVSSGILYLDNSGNIQTNNRLLSLNNLIIEGTNISYKSSNYNNLTVIQTSVSVTTSYLTTTGSRIYDGTSIINGNILLCSGVNGETFPIVGNGSVTNLLSANVTNDPTINLNSFDGLSLGESLNGALPSNYFTLYQSINYSAISITPATFRVTGSKVYDASNNILAQNCQIAGISGEIYTLSGYGLLTSKNVTTSSVNMSDISNLIISNGPSPSNYNNYYPLNTSNTFINVNKATLNILGSRIYDATYTISGSFFTAYGVNNETFSMIGSISIQSYNVQTTTLNNLGALGLGNSFNGAISSNYNDISGNNITITINPNNLSIKGTQTYNGRTSLIASNSFAYGINNEYFEMSGIGNSNNLSNPNKGIYILQSLDGLSLSTGYNSAMKINYNFIYNNLINSEITISRANLTLTGSKVYDGSNNILTNQCILLGVNGETFNLSGYGLLTTKNTTIRPENMSDISHLIINNGTDPSNYNSLSLSETLITVNPKPINFKIDYLVTKTYDGSNNYILNNDDINTLTSKLIIGDNITSIFGYFNDKNVGNNKVLSLSNANINDGNNGNNYIITYIDSYSNEILPKLLIIQANDAFKYFIDNDSIGYNSATYTGFIGSENISDISGSLLITRTNSSNNKPGVYTGVLVPSGYGNQDSINKNYKINYANGEFTIFGASSLQIYVGDSSNNTITNYGTFPTYNLMAKYIDSSGNIYNIPSQNITSELDFVIILDGIGGTITFYLEPNNIIISNSENYSYGSYTLIAIDVIFSNSTFKNINIIGNLIVNKYNINVVDLSITNITKVYDGNNNITTSMITSSPNVILNDIVNVNVLNGTFGDNNVGLNKIINIVIFLDGLDSNNYNLISNTLTNNIGSITQLSNVTLSTSGNWSVSSNWTGNAIPLLNNVINVIIPSSLQVTYDYNNLISNTPTSSILNNGIITFTGSNSYTFSNNVTENGSIIINTDTSNVIIISGNNNYSELIINQGILKIASSNAIGNTASINLYSSLDLNGYSIPNTITFYNGSLINSNLTPSILSGNITINSNVKISGNITINGIISNSSSTYGIVFGNGGNYNLDNSANNIFNIATFGIINSLFLRTISNLNISNLTINNNTYNSILSNGYVTLLSTKNITINSNNTINSTGLIILNANGNFINNSSSNAVSSSSSKWLIYSTDPSFNTFGGLNSTNRAIWGQTYNTYYPSTLNNNYYIFSTIGVVNINTSNATKIYGSIYNFSLDISSYTLSGNTQLASNYSNVFINSTLDDSSTGTLIIDSSGSSASTIIGNYPINSYGLSAKNGYIINNTNIGILTVNKATLNIIARNQTTTYGLGLTLGNNLYDLSGLVNNDKINSLILNQNGNNIIPLTQYADTYRGSINGIIPSNAQGSGLTNYNINYLSGVLTINPSSLIIKAKDQNTTYGSILQLGTILYDSSGLVNNEKISSITLKQNNSTNTSNNLSVGSYSDINGIIPSNPMGIITSNYNINYINGTLNITKAQLTYLANSITIEQDLLNNNINVSGTITGFLNSDSITNNTTGTLVFTTSVNTSSSIGSYPIIGSGLTSNNYNIINALSNNSALRIVDPGTPIISSISPNIGDINGNMLVSINGSNFQRGCTVTFGTVPSTNVNYIGTGFITVKSPKYASIETVHIVVSNSTINSNQTQSDIFTYASVPDIPTNLIAIADNKGASLSWQVPSNNGNSQITQYKIITNPNTNIIYSTISPIRISNLTNNLNYTFQVSAKNSIGFGSFSNESNQFTPYSPPQIISITPNYSSFSGGEQITIIGTNFYNVTKIQFGDSNIISYNVNSNTNITFTIPSTSKSGSINTSITATGGTVTNTNGFTYYDVPSIISISPLSGTSVGGTQITITGSNFTNKTLVTIGSYNTNIISITDSTIIITTTSYEITENIILSLPLNVSTLGGTSSYNYYTYVLPQKLSSTLLVTPDLLYIFGSNIAGSLVTINGQSADYILNKSISEINVTYSNNFLNGNSINISNSGMDIEFNLDTSNIQQNYYGSSLSKIITE